MKGHVAFLQTEGNSQGLIRALETLGLRAEAFVDPRHFLKCLKEAKPQVCLIDLTFKDAPVLVSMIKSIRSVLGKNMTIMVLAIREGQALARKAIEAGANEIVDKASEKSLSAKLAKYFPSAAKPVKVEIPAVVKWFFTELSPALAGLNGSLVSYDSIEAQVNFYSERLASDRALFINMINTLRKSETKPDLLQAIRLYGLRNAKNLVVATRLSDVTKSGILKWDSKTGLLSTEPARLLQYAVKAVDHFGESSRYQHTAFSAGLVMDLLFVLAESAGNRKAAIRKLIQDSFDQALKRADLGLAAAKQVEDLALEQHVLTAHLMSEAGKIAMAIHFPDYLDVKQKMDRKGVRPVIQHIVEMKKYSISQNILGSLICQGAPGLHSAYTAVLFFDYAFMVSDLPQMQDSYNLIRVCQPQSTAGKTSSKQVPSA